MGAHILVVDDDELVRSGLRLNLEGEGYRVSTASSASEALAIAARESLDLILCDLVLGDGDGISVLREVRARWPELPLILITAHGSIHNALEALQAGARDYIQKPANPDEVAHRIRSILDQESMRRSLASERERSETRRREMDEALARTERMASLGLLAEGAATHLQGILQPLEDIPRRLAAAATGDATVAQVAKEIGDTSRQAWAVLEDLRTLGQSARFDKAEVSLQAILDAFVKSPEYVRLRRSHPQIRVEMHASGAIPHVHGALDALSQVVENMLLNACESAAPAGQVDVTLLSEQVDRPVGRYGRGIPGQYVILRIRDSGASLSDEDAERFFEPFFALKRMGREALSGLGLTLVLRTLHEHGGYLDLTHDGGGNTFHVYLPALGSSMDESSETWAGSEIVLVVDDYEVHRQHARELLEGFGYRVLTAATHQEALDVCQRQSREGRPVHLVVMDLLLGGTLDGVDAVRLLREGQPELRTLLVSGFAETARIVEARKLGLRHWLQKPLTSAALGKAARRALDEAG